MRAQGKIAVGTVALISATPALSSILNVVLAADPGLRVRAYVTAAALRTYMRVVPVGLLVADFDNRDAPADLLAATLRADPALAQPSFPIIALTRAVTEATRRAAIGTGIDEVIVKPMSPRYLLERVRARLGQPPVHLAIGDYRGPDRRDRARFPLPEGRQRTRGSDNVVSLFPAGGPQAVSASPPH